MGHKRNVVALAGILSAVTGVAWGQNAAGIKLNPGERLVAINGVPVAGDAASGPIVRASSGQGRGNVTRAQGYVPVASSNIAGRLVRSNMPFSHTPGNTALDKANAERARQGERALLPDPRLQALALQKATMAAQRGYKNHVGGSLGGAKCEGVGHTNGRFLSCCLNEPGTYGGAAMVQGADGWYCCLLVR